MAASRSGAIALNQDDGEASKMALLVLTDGDDRQQFSQPVAVLGQGGNDSIEGSSGDDILYGGLGDDTLIGGDGADVLGGNQGTNRLRGGAGSDIFVIERGTVQGRAVQEILDFDATRDRIGLAPGLKFSDLQIEREADRTTDGLLAGSNGLTDLVSDRFVEAEVLQFSASEFRISEDGTPLGAITIERSFPYLQSPIVTKTVTVELANNTATVDRDLKLDGPVLAEFDADERSTAVVLPLVDDLLVEGTETLRLRLTNPTGGSQLGDRTTAQLLIADNDQPAPLVPGRLDFSGSVYSVEENENTALIAITRTGGSNGAITATVEILNDSAIVGRDLGLPEPAIVRFADGDQTPQFVRVPLVDNAIEDGNRSAILRLVSLTGGAITGERPAARLEIVDNDAAAGTLSFSQPIFSAIEGQAVATVTVTRANGSSGVVSALVSTTGGTVTLGSDFTIPASTIVTFADGDDTSKTIQFPLIDDPSLEPTERLELSLLSPTGGALVGRQGTAAIEIADNDRFVAQVNFDRAINLQPIGTDPLTGLQFSNNALGIVNYDAGGSGNYIDPLLTGGAAGRALTYGEGRSIILNVAGGFRDRLSFRYAAPFELDRSRDPDGDGLHEVTIYDGPNGTGNILATINLARTADSNLPVGAYALTRDPIALGFSGIARSVSFGSQADKLLLDDIAIG
ncbi:MAG: hypothetical protein EA001_01120 [Oscillatoriales cyanobacterium]|nr:MAG: hypothetical protein EA001_01120 [Oscillatoriales cyanobacterium]